MNLIEFGIEKGKREGMAETVMNCLGIMALSRTTYRKLFLQKGIWIP